MFQCILISVFMLRCICFSTFFFSIHVPLLMFQYILILVFMFHCSCFSTFLFEYSCSSVLVSVSMSQYSWKLQYSSGYIFMNSLFRETSWQLLSRYKFYFQELDTGSLRSETNTFRLKIYPQFAIMYRQLQMPALYIYCIHCNSDSNDIATIDGGFNMLSLDYFISSKFSSIVKELVSIYVWCHFICCMSW